MLHLTLLFVRILVTFFFINQVLGGFDNRPIIESYGGNLHISVPSGAYIKLDVKENGKLYVGNTDLTAAIKKIIVEATTEGIEIKFFTEHKILCLSIEVLQCLGIEDKHNFQLGTSMDTLQQCKADSSNALEKILKVEAYVSGPTGTLNRINYLERLANSTNSIMFALNRPLRRRVTMMQKRLALLIRSLSLNECNSQPCINGGTCQDQFNAFNCLCATGWEGGTCERDVNECTKYDHTELGCQNGATCLNKPGSYECKCTDGWYGLHCTMRTQDCNNTVEICGHGACIPLANGHKCLCEQGWKVDSNGACTLDVNECEAYHPPCSSNPPVACVNLPGTFYCGHCPAGYTGNGFYCADINECEILNGGCSMYPMVQCVNVPGSRICGRCPPGYSGDGVRCIFQGVCGVSNGGCHPLAQCRDNPRISETYVECICPSGYSGDGIGPNGCLKGTQDACASNPCMHGICEATATGYSCNCSTRYTGRNCDIRKDACISGPCQNGGTCKGLVFSFYCVCASGFSGTYCQNTMTCGQMMGPNGTFTYPAAGTVINRNTQISCAWRIKASNAKVINVTFHGVYLPMCTHNYLQIHDGKDTGSPLLGRFCENKLKNGSSIISNTDLLYLWFKGDGQAPTPYVNISWESINPICGSYINITDPGTFKSPGSPQNYPSNRDCYWHLEAPSGQRIKFTFYHLDIGNNSDCNKDTLMFNEGLEPSSKFFFQQCTSSSTIEPIISPINRVTVHLHTVDEHTGFLIHYSLVQGRPGCGGIYTHTSGHISSPKILADAEEMIGECEYLIKLPYTTRLLLHFSKFNTGDCDVQNSLSIHENIAIAPLVGRYCGTSVPSDIITEMSQIRIVYKYTAKTDNSYGFELEYKTVCGGHYTAESSTIESPNYPVPITVDEPVECVYTILRPPGSRIQIDVVDLNFGNWSSNFKCQQGSLNIYDGNNFNSSALRQYCSHPPATIYSKSNVLTIKYTVTSGTIVGFRLNYQTLSDSDCGGVLTDKFGSIESPKFLDTYEQGLNCSWLLSAPPGYLIEINWLQFNLESSYQCTYDYVKVFDNATDPASEMGTFCGNRLPPAMTTTSNVATILFKIDGLNNYDGFYLSYRFISGTIACGGQFFSPNGIITSPLYPANYPNNRNCIWVITVPQGEQIQLNITFFNVELSNMCRYDYLQILNGGSLMAPLIGKYCGTTIPKLIYSHTNKIHLQFVSDKTKNSIGFSLIWSSAATGCGGTLNGATGTIISPHYPEPYGRNAECFWKIGISAGSKIQAVFADLELEFLNGCAMDYVEFYDGSDTMSKKLGRYCKINSGSPVIHSSSNQLMVKFHSDITYQGRGFQLQYSTVCKTNVTGFYGVIESPNYPNKASKDIDCVWEITVPLGNKINITFSTFDIGSLVPFGLQTCDANYLQILSVDTDLPGDDAQTLVGKYCDANRPDDSLSLPTHKALIKFHTGMGYYPSTFRLEWSMSGCGGFLTRPTGVLQTPNYPNSYPVHTHCEWQIQTDFGKSIEITFTNIDLEMNKNCGIDFVKVFNGPDISYQEIATICHSNTQPTIVTGTGRDMFVQFVSDISYTGKGFIATYRTVDSKCGGTFTATSGVIHSPNYPLNYDRNDSCSWLINVEENHLIDLTFESVDLLSICDSTFIKVYDGPSPAYPLLTKICGSTKPNDTLTSRTNHLYIELVTHAFLTTKGFLAKYSTACGARIQTQGGGIIEYQPETLATTNVTNCTWTIMAENPEQHVLLTFTSFQRSQCYLPSDSITIYDGENHNSSKIGTYCEKMPGVIKSSGSMLHIELPESNNEIFRFSARYSVVESSCGGTFNSESGQFSTPEYPNSYPVDLQCEWIINAGIGNEITVEFTTFDLVQSTGCNEDYLEIREASRSGRLIGTFCGNEKPLNVTGKTTLWLYFKSEKPAIGSEGVTGKGFLAEFALSTFTKLFGSNGTITSPLYPARLTTSNIYKWQVTVEPGYSILLKYPEINFEYGTGDYCYGASVSIFDGNEDASLISQICSPSQDPVKSTANFITMVLSGSYSTRGVQFLLNWQQISAHEANSSECSKNQFFEINSETKVLEFTHYRKPNFPDANSECEWIYVTQPGRHLNVTFKEINIFNLFNCRGDALTIYDGNGYDKNARTTTGFTKKALVCNATSINQTIEVEGDSMRITYTPFRIYLGSRHIKHIARFKANISDVCGGILDRTNGIVIVDGQKEVKTLNRKTLECKWKVKVATGKLISFDILANISKNTNCSKNAMIYDGHSQDSPVLQKYCGSPMWKQAKTLGNVAFVIFRASYNDMRYQSVSSTECGGSITLSQNDNSTEISSPNYPNAPPQYAECIWTILAPQGEALRVDFLERFDLQQSIGCSVDGVELRDGATKMSPLVGRFCALMPSTQSTINNVLYVRYYTNAVDPRNGFKAKVSMKFCGGTIRGTQGSLSSPGYKHRGSYPTNITCMWEIEAPEGHNMNLTFENLDISRLAKLRIFEKDLMNNNTTRPLFTFTNQQKPKIPLQSSSNRVFITLFTGRTGPFDGFKISFASSQEECGGSLTTSSGTVMSPLYPMPTKVKRTCEWSIKVPKGQRIKLTFDEVLSGNANEGIACFSGESFGSNVLFLSGSDDLNEHKAIRSSGNIMKIYYWSYGDDPVRGFKASYTSDEPTVCKGDTTQPAGTITNPSEPSYTCQWSIEPKNMTTSKTISIGINAQFSSGSTFCSYSNDGIFISEGEMSFATNANYESIVKICDTTLQPVVMRTIYHKAVISVSLKKKLRQMNFTINYKVNNCGGEVGEPSGSLNIPQREGLIDCAWKLLGVEGEQHSVTVKGQLLCTESYLLVFNGPNAQSHKIKKICGPNIDETIRSQGRYLWLEYRGTNSSILNLTHDKISKICGGINHESESVLQSPGYPNGYDNNEECLWELKAQNGYHISLSFTDRFQLEESDNCQNDYVAVYENEVDEKKALKYCGRHAPAGINSTSNRLFILFRTNERVTGSGFKAAWKWSCGGTYNATYVQQYIESPGYPENYKNNLQCQYIINAPRKYIKITFEEFDLEKASDCLYDHVTVRSGISNWYNRKMPKFCGDEIPQPIRIYQTANLTFISDRWVNRKGFKLSYEIDFCGGNITEPTQLSGRSINNPRDSNPFYLSPVYKCAWNITAPKDKRIIIRFEKVNITYNIYCYSQYVSVYDNVGKMATLCGDLSAAALPLIHSNKNEISLRFQYLNFDQRPVMFDAFIDFTYGPETGCGGLIDLKNTPSKLLDFKPPGNNYDCIWHIQTSIDYTIRVSFTTQTMPSCTTNENIYASDNGTCCIYYEMRDGNTTLADKIVGECDLPGGNEVNYVSSGPVAQLRIAGVYKKDKMAKIRIYRQMSICGHLNLSPTNQSQFISSPNFPSSYPTDLRCVWRIKTRYIYGIYLRFVEFNLNSKNNNNLTKCSNLDRLEIVDRTNKAFHLDYDLVLKRKASKWDLINFDTLFGEHTFCNPSDKDYEFVSTNNHLQLSFYSDSIQKPRNSGFKIEYKIADCNRNYTALSGSLPRTWQLTNCTSHIIVPKNYTIALFITKPNGFLISCQLRMLNVYDGDGTKGEPVMRGCGSQQVKAVFSTGNILTLKLLNFIGQGLYSTDMTYVATDKGRGCGGDLYMFKGSFMSPLHPEPYLNADICRWTIKVPLGLQLALSFKWFDIKGPCTQTYVKLIQSNLLEGSEQKYCTGDTPSIFIATSGSIVVEYKSGPANTGTGWRAAFMAITSDIDFEKFRNEK